MDDTPSKIASNNQDRSPQLGHSTQSSTSLASGSTLLDDQDEDVRIAVKALGDMRNGGLNKRCEQFSVENSSKLISFVDQSVTVTSPTPALSISSSSIPATSLPSPTQSNSFDLQPESDFVSRMAHIPLVNGALRMYEQGKASSRVVKYGAEIMESGVKTISRPVIDRLPTGQLDDFACRQLDRGYLMS
ncbi:hypothetical protein D9757_001203 [Collybiopsis confluens]|uniref:Uncharacterized protein n=1 Tax=Collybiopsis confluens TaxID=2823264 RepID=A0A8H5I166_9AGAR|nr:hypothetical protein D9757_001203 [Collybiopsis confluens]